MLHTQLLSCFAAACDSIILSPPSSMRYECMTTDCGSPLVHRPPLEERPPQWSKSKCLSLNMKNKIIKTSKNGFLDIGILLNTGIEYIKTESTTELRSSSSFFLRLMQQRLQSSSFFSIPFLSSSSPSSFLLFAFWFPQWKSLDRFLIYFIYLLFIL